jgi:predicted phage-related endonuclease
MKDGLQIVNWDTIGKKAETCFEASAQNVPSYYLVNMEHY